MTKKQYFILLNLLAFAATVFSAFFLVQDSFWEKAVKLVKINAGICSIPFFLGLYLFFAHNQKSVLHMSLAAQTLSCIVNCIVLFRDGASDFTVVQCVVSFSILLFYILNICTDRATVDHTEKEKGIFVFSILLCSFLLFINFEIIFNAQFRLYDKQPSFFPHVCFGLEFVNALLTGFLYSSERRPLKALHILFGINFLVGLGELIFLCFRFTVTINIIHMAAAAVILLFCGLACLLICLTKKEEKTEPTDVSSAVSSAISFKKRIDKLEALAELKDSGILTEEEFQTEKNKLLGGH